MNAIDPAYLNAYIDRLQAHDWHYEKSDDMRGFKAGQASRLALEREAALDSTGTLQTLLNAMATIQFGRDGSIEAHLSWREYVDLVLRRVAPNAPARATEAQQLARAVRGLAHALAKADPDNALSGRAIGLLQRLGMLDSTLLHPPEKPT